MRVYVCKIYITVFLLATSQDFEGDTALHRAVKKHQSKAVAILLDAGADPTVFNHDYLTPILVAAMNAFFP